MLRTRRWRKRRSSGCRIARYGERVCAFIVTRGGQTLDLDAVRSHFEFAGVARHKTPEFLRLVPELPRTAAGKVKKAELRATCEGLVGGRALAQPLLEVRDPAPEQLDRFGRVVAQLMAEEVVGIGVCAAPPVLHEPEAQLRQLERLARHAQQFVEHRLQLVRRARSFGTTQLTIPSASASWRRSTR